MIRLLIILLILAFVASKLYGLPDGAEPRGPRTPTSNPINAPTPIPTSTPKPPANQQASKILGAPAPLPPVSATPGVMEKIVTGAGTALAGIGTLIRDGTVELVDHGDETSRAMCGLLGVVWTVCGLAGFLALRLVGKLLCGLFG